MTSHVRTEREVKLRPPPGFDLSSLDRKVTDTEIDTLSTLDLKACYFDVPPLLAGAPCSARGRRSRSKCSTREPVRTRCRRR